MNQTLLITGSAGEIGRDLRRSLARPGRTLRLFDIAPQEPPAAGEQVEIVTGSFTDPDAITAACAGVDAILHLGSVLGGAGWDEYLDVNINGTYRVLEAARLAGVTRVIYASSHHAVGFVPKTPGTTAPDYAYPRPDSLYGVAKVASEALCSLYFDRFGIEAICVRIASYRPHPDSRRALWNWLSPADMTRIVESSLEATDVGFRIIWGVSGNTRGWMSLEEGNAMGYHPEDDAEAYAADVTQNYMPEPFDGFLGGAFCAPEFDHQARA